MSVARLALVLALSLLVVAPVALASPFWPGPHFGVVEEGDVGHHHFALFPFSQPCKSLPTEHVLTLVYTPPTDTLTLTVRRGLTVLGESVGENGIATVSFSAPPCTWYVIQVAGTDVESVAAYDVAQAFTPDA